MDSLDDATARAPSRLPDWSVGHVLTHIARNADGHTRRLEGALRGENVPRYPGGMQQRDDDIAAGAGRPAAELADDIRTSAAQLEEIWQRCTDAGWDFDPELLADDDFTISESPARRLREVEVHHVDLGLGHEPLQWPAEYVEWELTQMLQRLPSRLTAPDARTFLACLLGRGDWPSDVELQPWES